MKLPCPTCNTIMDELSTKWSATFASNLYLACGNTNCPSAYLLPTSNYVKINENLKSEKYGFIFVDQDNPRRRWQLQGDILFNKTDLLNASGYEFNQININTMTSAGYNYVVNKPMNITTITTNSGIQAPFIPITMLDKPIISIPFFELTLETDKFASNVNYLFNRLKNMVIFS